MILLALPFHTVDLYTVRSQLTPDTSGDTDWQLSYWLYVCVCR